MNKTNEENWSNGSKEASVTDNGKRVLRLGLDVHYRQVTVAIQEDGGRIKAAGRMKHPVFLDWIQKKLDQGWEICSCYEAGASGFAGALGKKVYLLLHSSADWRWLQEREDSPWYPTMKLLRQSQADDWKSVVNRLVGKIAKDCGDSAGNAGGSD